jgi:D-alanyl-D-alanine dipeptidase
MTKLMHVISCSMPAQRQLVIQWARTITTFIAHLENNRSTHVVAGATDVAIVHDVTDISVDPPTRMFLPRRPCTRVCLM